MKKITLLKNNTPTIIEDNYLKVILSKKLDKDFFNLPFKRIAVSYVMNNKTARIFYSEVRNVTSLDSLVNKIVTGIKDSGFDIKVDKVILYYGEFKNKNKNKKSLNNSSNNNLINIFIVIIYIFIIFILITPFI
jgi:hypothetical protein